MVVVFELSLEGLEGFDWKVTRALAEAFLDKGRR